MERLIQQWNIQDALEKNNIEDAQTLLSLLPLDASRMLRITPTQTNELYNAASHELYCAKQQYTNMLSLQDSYVTTQDPHIDDIVGKGIPIGSITEVVGESSSGKTQLCLQLCFTVQQPIHLGGLGSEAVYIHNEGKFSSNRCHQLATWFGKQYNLLPSKMTEAIHTMYVPTTEAFFRSIAYQLPVLLERQKKIRLVVIDSLGSAYRGCGTEQQRMDQFDTLQEICELGWRLKKLAHEYQIAIVVVNQVSDIIIDDRERKQNSDGYLPSSMKDWLDITLEGDHMTRIGMFIQSLAKKPILGMTWSNSVTTRIRMARSLMMDGQPTRRALLVEFSSLVPRRGCEITIDERGIRSKIELDHLEQ
ncbi:P-loop containing nucleoside triphosphate hydrolase protein [Halteromyces radiatus]|uniref:P-loop containing nucleoside triphosphate hydrolase protein n=1 Tax=Halteromyces radiatus TaxID=101107 RepID=UPI0022201D27|nr:P-loop containing nucleoside triphosphate hydrolase protein [Halteromyces radiatus]KAI8093207.1 P-loop containing nucleoside triphosphate hydrolase protein [Halteromyces radiatus]